MDKPKFVYVTYIASTPEKIWEALTSGELSEQYWGGNRIVSEFGVGAPLRFENGCSNVSGVVLEYDEPRRLSYTWHMEGRAPEPDSRVTFTLEPLAAHVKLTLIHDNFEHGSAIFSDIGGGWPVVLCGLKTLLETGETMDILGRVRIAQAH